MVTSMNWFIAVSVGVVAIAFVALIIFVIMTLISLRKMVDDLDTRVRTFDPLLRVVNKAGNAIERKTAHIKQLSDEIEDEEEVVRHESRRGSAVNTAMEVAEWALIGMALWDKIKEKKWRS